MARVYRSAKTPDRDAAVVVDVHGGAWSNLDRTAGARYDRALAERGFLVVAVDFRQAPEDRHPSGSADIAGAIRWVRGQAGGLGADPGRIGLVGSSSGGHLALLVGCRPNEAEHAPGIDPGDAEGDASVACVAALWPPVDPRARYRFACEQQQCGPPALRAHYTNLMAGSLGYFGDEATMESASVADLVGAGRASVLPPIWLCYPTADANVPRAIVDRLRDSWAAAGGAVELTLYHGQVHGFGHQPGGAAAAFVDDLAGFFHRHL